MKTRVPAAFADLAEPMQIDHHRILAALDQHGLHWPPYPQQFGTPDLAGQAAARAYPMQGILKYHGMSDWEWRIAFLPSISVCNDAGATLTLVEFDPALEHDTLMIGGRPASGRELERVTQSLDAIRRLAGVATRARVRSRNTVRASIFGKGLGTSASASAALALAAIGALYGSELAANSRFVSAMARLLAGSGCRSATGGVSLWLAYPGIQHDESFAIRLDNAQQLDTMRLIAVPIDTTIGLHTEAARHGAPPSSFFRAWMQSRTAEVLECLAAVRRGDWQTLGQWAEIDSMRLHGVTMSGGNEQKLIGWEPINISFFRMCNRLRADGIPVYCST
ncbi:MAG TPA: GHMP kinase, partial [Roseiflexaceae bacterium]|nr:GHMP kinase [Roseiflexaceae bacterium]